PVQRQHRTIPSCSSESLQLGKWQFPLVDMHRAEFRATMQGGNVLAWIEQPLLVESRLNFMKEGDFVVIELHTHLVDLLAPHAMFARDAATHFHTERQYLAAQLLGTRKLARDVGIEKNQRMHIAVASVKHIGNLQPILLG